VPKFFFARGFAQKPAPDVIDAYLAPWKDRRRRVAAVVAPRQLMVASDYLREVEQGLTRFADRPVLIVWGTRDFAFGEAARVCFERRFPRHRTVLLSNASHFLQENVGDQIAEAFRAFRKEGG
jgi:haloalkane dehalogenase